MSGRPAIIKRLLDKENVDLETEDDDYCRTPLF